MRNALVEYDVMKTHLEDKKKEVALAVGETIEIKAKLLQEKLRSEEMKKVAQMKHSVLAWRLATTLLKRKESKYEASEDTKAVLPYLSLAIPQPILITKKVAGVKALSIEETIATCCKLLEAKVKADAADLKREEEREAMPAYIEEYFTKTTRGGSREATKLFQSLILSLRQQYRHAGGSHKV